MSKEGRRTPLAVGEGNDFTLPTPLPAGVANIGEASGVAIGERAPDSQSPRAPKVRPGQASLPSDTSLGSAAATAEHLESDHSTNGAPESNQSSATAAPLVTALGVTVVVLGAIFAVRRRLARRGAGPRHRAVPVQEAATTPLQLPDVGVGGLPIEISMGLLVPDSIDPVVQGGSDTESFEMVPVPGPASTTSAASTHLASALAGRKATTRVTRGHTRLHDEASEVEAAASTTRKIRLPAATRWSRIGSTYGRLHDNVEPPLQGASPEPPPGARTYPGPNELDWSCPTSSMPTRVPRFPAEVTDVGFELD